MTTGKRISTALSLFAAACAFSGAASAQARPARVPQDELLGKLSGDAPFCDTCGHITVRNGTCYKCLNCGNSMGCS